MQDSLAARKLSSANDVAQARDLVTEMKQRLDIEQKRLDDVVGSEKSQIQLNEQQIDGLKRILADQRRRVASMRVTSPEARSTPEPRQPAARARSVRQRRYAARPRGSARQTQSGSPGTRESRKGRRARSLRHDRPSQQYGREGSRHADRSVVGARHGHGRSPDSRPAPGRHPLRPRGRRNDSDRKVE